MFRRGSGGVQSNCLNHFSICRRFHLFDLFNDVTCETFVKVLETFTFSNKFQKLFNDEKHVITFAHKMITNYRKQI